MTMQVHFVRVAQFRMTQKNLSLQIMSSDFSGIPSEDIVDVLNRAARVSNTCCRFEIAEQCAQACIDVAARVYGRHHFRFGAVLLSYGNLLLSKDKINSVWHF
jgi:hypothetical protein